MAKGGMAVGVACNKKAITFILIHVTWPNLVENTRKHMYTFIGHGLPRPYTLAPPIS